MKEDAAVSEVALLRVATLSVGEVDEIIRTGDTSRLGPVLGKAMGLATEYAPDQEDRRGRDSPTLRYVSRMGCRATPFGLFAGFATVDVGRHRQLHLSGRDEHRVRVRLDAGALSTAVLAGVAAHPKAVKYSANPSIQRRDGVVRYAKRGDSNAPIVELRLTNAISSVLGLVADRARSIDEIAAGLSTSPEQQSAVSEFVERLAERELLMPDTSLLVPGTEPLNVAVELLESSGAPSDAEALDRLGRATCGVWTFGEFIDLDLDKPWQEACNSIADLTEVKAQYRYHVDLELKTPGASLDHATTRSLRLATEIVTSCFPPRDPLKRFKEVFRQQYEDTRVPLLMAIDPDRGLRPSLDRRASQLAGDAAVFREGATTAAMREVSEVSLRALAAGAGAGTVDLLRSAIVPANGLGASATRVLHAALLDPVAGFDAMLLGGYSRGALGPLSRFSMYDTPMTDYVQELTRREADSGVVRAELLFGGHYRLGNITLRPRLYEDTVSLDGDGTTRPADIDISVTVHDQLLLWHRPTGRPLEIELNSAHNAMSQHANPVYTFLALAGSWGGITWEWGPLAQLPHLPRVTAGRIILATERWLVERAALAAAVSDRNPARRLRELLPGIGDRRWVGFGADDKTLAVNLACDQSVSALLTKGVTEPTIAFRELPYVEHPAAMSDAGAHVAEVMLPIPSSQGGRTRPSTSRIPPAFDGEHGRRWVYARYHCGPGTSDPVIVTASDLMRRFRDGGLASQWFFVRYDDGVPHVRVRVRPEDGQRSEVMREMEELGHRLGDQGIVNRVVFDTYVPEVSRYAGIESLRLAERLFSADSDSVSALLGEKPSERERLDAGTAAALLWAATVAPADQDQLDLLVTLRDRIGLMPSKGTGRLARDRKSAIAARLAEPPSSAGDVHTALGGLVSHVATVDPPFVPFIVGSCLHMHFNRLFAVDNLRLEWLCCEFACRIVRSRIARQTTHAQR